MSVDSDSSQPPNDEAASGAGSDDGGGFEEIVPAGAELVDIAELKRLQAQADELKDRWMRQVAEFQNYKKRVARDHERMRDLVTVEVLDDFLPVVDDFDRALAAADRTAGADDLASLRAGMGMIAAALKQVLQQHGVEEITGAGQPFNPQLHEAIMQMSHPSLPAGTVIEVATKGYQLRGRLMRPAKVVVATGAGESPDSGRAPDHKQPASPAD